MKSLRRLSVGIAMVGAAVMIPASFAWACISLAGITTSAASLQSGGTVTVNGIEFGTNPVQLHLDSLTGPVLATAVPDTTSGNFTQAVTLPADVGSGQHVLVATEAAATPDGKNKGSSTGVPARAAIQVGTGTPAPAATPVRPLQVSSNSGTSVGTLALIGLAVAAAGLFLAGSVSLAASRRRRPQGEAVEAS